MDHEMEFNDQPIREDGTYRYIPAQPEPVYTPPVEPVSVPPVEPVKKKKKRGAGCLGIVAVALSCSILGGLVGAGAVVGADRMLRKEHGSSILMGERENTVLDTTLIDTSRLMSAAEVYAANVNSTVGITTSITTNFWGYSTTSAASGSGFIISADGYILTNHHVIEGSSAITVAAFDGTTYDAKLIGYDESNDIAVLKVEAQDLPPVVLGDSDNMNVGDSVVAIGNPLGELTFSLTAGAVSAMNREVTLSSSVTMDLIQTDCAINSGNSGGALFNMYGEVIGITSAKYSGTTTSGATIEGIGFAIPTDDVIMMLEDLKTFGYVTGGYLGVTVTEVSEEANLYYGLPLGVLVREVMPGSCAEKAGMRSQDIIIDLGGNEVKNLNGLSRALNKFKAGQEVIVTVYRSGREVQLTVILDERPQEEQKETQIQTTVPTDPYTPWPGDSYIEDWFGQFFG